MSQILENAERKEGTPASTLQTVGMSSGEDVIDLRILTRILLRWWWLMILMALVGVAKGVWDMHNFTPSSIASMIVSPVGAEPTIDLQGKSRFGLGGAIGKIAFGANRPATKFDEAVHAASTITLARSMQEKYGLLQVLYADAWDEDTQTWKRPEGSAFERQQRINQFLSLRTWTPPDLEDLALYLGGGIKVIEVGDTPFKKISFTHKDPQRALRLLSIIYEEATEYIRDRDHNELQERKEFIQQQLNNTSVTDFRQALTSLLVNEARREMALQKGLPYVARVIEPPHVSKYKTEPNQIRLVGVPAVFGFAGGFFVVLLIALARRE